MRLVASTALFASLVDASPNGTASSTARPDMPHYPLFNAAEPGTTFPAIGFGSGAYGSDPECEARPGCMSIASGCGDCAYASMLTWLRSGGRRLDLAHGYNNDAAVARAIADSGVPRSELFILSKISLGHADALLQISNILRDLETDYVDALLIHWPRRGGTGLDPLCNPPVDERACRISTWRAMLEIFHRGSARSIGVSNYYPEHFAVRASSKLNASSQSTGRQEAGTAQRSFRQPICKIHWECWCAALGA
jgi:diketogulonate reductase-like aldo/keto reductase